MAYVNVDTSRPNVLLVVGSVQPTQNLGGIQASTLGKCSWDDLEGLSVLLDGVLEETGGLLAVRNDALNKLHLGRTGTWYEAGVSCDGLDNVDTVIDSTLQIIQVVLGGASNDDGRGLCGLVLCKTLIQAMLSLGQ